MNMGLLTFEFHRAQIMNIDDNTQVAYVFEVQGEGMSKEMASPQRRRGDTRGTCHHRAYRRYFLGIGCVRQSNGPSLPLPRMRDSKKSRFVPAAIRPCTVALSIEQ